MSHHLGDKRHFRAEIAAVFKAHYFHTCPLSSHSHTVCFSLPWRGTVASNCKHTYIISLNRFNGFSGWKPRLWAVPFPRHYIIARQACLRRQICTLQLQTEAQGASSASDEPLQHTNTQTLREFFSCQDCCTCSAASAQTVHGGDTNGRRYFSVWGKNET